MYKVVKIDQVNSQIHIVIDGDKILPENLHALGINSSQSKLEIEQMCEVYAKQVLDQREMDAKFALELSKIKVVEFEVEVQ